MADASRIEDLRPGDHACLTFTDVEERLDLVAAFVRDGIRVATTWADAVAPSPPTITCPPAVSVQCASAVPTAATDATSTAKTVHTRTIFHSTLREKSTAKMLQ